MRSPARRPEVTTTVLSRIVPSDTDRRATVAEAVRATALAESGAYQRAVERLERHDVGLADAASEG